jgi:hypothetical protein
MYFVTHTSWCDLFNACVNKSAPKFNVDLSRFFFFKECPDLFGPLLLKKKHTILMLNLSNKKTLGNILPTNCATVTID